MTRRSLPRALIALVAPLGVAACGGPPPGIPNTPGTIDADVLQDLITVGSPDLPFLLWLTPTQLAGEDWRACPQVFLQDDGTVVAKGDGCVDSSGIQWFGTVSLIWDPESRRETVSLREFGADDGTGGWTADGTVRVAYTEAGSGFLIDTDVSMISLSGESPLLLWANTSSAYTTYEGIWYADRHDGMVGREEWGVAEVVTRNTPLSFVYDCGWAAHIAGSMAFDGQNEAFVNFYTGPLGISLPPPADTGDTAGPGDDTGPGDTSDDTGEHTDTGDTAETGDTGDTDTDPDTDTDTSPPDFDDDDDPDGACGTCRDAAIGTTDLAECLDLTRNFNWPFPPPF